MNALALSGIIVAGIGVIMLLVFLLPAGIEFFGKIGRWISKFWLAILGIFGFYMVLLGQKVLEIKNNMNAEDGILDVQNLNSQTEIFIFACTSAILLGLLLVIWQINTWANRNSVIYAQIQKVVHQICKLEESIKSAEK